MRRFKRKKTNILPKSGFTLIELIVVLAGLGILSSLALPNFINLLDSNNVDEIKSLLNSAAADCLQNKRSQTDPIVNDEIISDDRIKDVGYKIDTTNSILDANGKPKCSLLLLEPINGDINDNVRYNIGFQLLSNGKLDKLASSEVGTKIPDCTKWAGTCEFSQDSKILQEYKDEIRAAREACDLKLTDWKKDMNPAKFQQWDSTKGPDTCPLSPPGGGDTSYQGSSSCTTAGCTKDIWGLWDKDTKTGSTYNSETAYEKARLDMIGVKCAKQIKDEYEDPKKSTTINGFPLSECNDDIYWFFEGNNAGSMVEWEKLYHKANNPSGPQPLSDGTELYLCLGKEIETEDLMTQCINNDEKATCENKITNRINSKENGYFKAQDSGPIPCTNEYWFCDGTDKETEAGYNDSACGKKDCGPPPLGLCTRPAFYSNDFCAAWARCEGLI